MTSRARQSFGYQEQTGGGQKVSASLSQIYAHSFVLVLALAACVNSLLQIILGLLSLILYWPVHLVLYLKRVLWQTLSTCLDYPKALWPSVAGLIEEGLAKPLITGALRMYTGRKTAVQVDSYMSRSFPAFPQKPNNTTRE